MEKSLLFHQEMVTHCLQRLSGPAQEPVNSGAIDERRILPEVVLKLVSVRTHDQEDMEVPLATSHKDLVRCQFDSSDFLHLLFDLVVDLFFVFSVEQGGELTHVEYVVYVFNKALLFDVFVRKLEDCLLVVDAESLVEVAKVVSPFELPVVFVDGDFKRIALVYKRSQLGYGFAAVATKANEEAISERFRQYSRNAG